MLYICSFFQLPALSSPPWARSRSSPLSHTACDGKSRATSWRTHSLLQTFKKVLFRCFLSEKQKNNPRLDHHIWPSFTGTQPAKPISICRYREMSNCTVCRGCLNVVGRQAVVGGKACSSPPPWPPNPLSSLLKPHVQISRDFSA